jgi:hypothetical protein
MTSEDFHEYWENVHADFALSLPGFKQIAKRYTQVSHPLKMPTTCSGVLINVSSLVSHNPFISRQSEDSRPTDIGL